MVNGYNGVGLDINLTSGKISKFEIEDHILKKYFGGRGLGSYYLSREVAADTDPLSGDNVLVFSTGGLSGSLSPATGRFSVTFKSPLSGTISSANSGGFWGNGLKRTGHDLILVRGVSAAPVYIYLSETQTEIVPCPELWGQTLPRFTRVLEGKYPGQTKILGIGPAGENQVRFASIMNDYNRAVGRGGAGAVMGAKNLKAIVVTGKKTFRPANKDLYQAGLDQANKLIKNLPVTSRALTELGTAGLVNLIYNHDMLPRHNFMQVSHKKEDIARISGETLRLKFLKTKKGCYNCTIQCGRATQVGKKKGEGPEYETIAMMGANLGIYDLREIALANYLCNENGIDTISFGGTVALAMELFEKGILTHKDTEGLEVRFGNAPVLKTLVQLTAEKKGFGNLLSEGALRLGKRFDSEKLAMVVKGLEFPGYDPRASLMQALGYATSTRGGCHLKGGYAVCLGFFGGSREVNRFLLETSAGHCVEAQDSGCVTDALGVCRFVSYSVDEKELSRIYSGFTGLDVDPQMFLNGAQKIHNLERTFNLAAGFSKKDDTLPERFFSEPVVISGKLRAIDKEHQFDNMLAKYYEIREWDKHTPLQT